MGGNYFKDMTFFSYSISVFNISVIQNVENEKVFEKK